MSSWIFFLTACVWDRTGQSMTTALRRQVQHNSVELEQLQTQVKNVTDRVSQLEEVTRSRGRSEILGMENMDQLRTEIANLRNDVEVLGYEEKKQEQAFVALTEDSAYRLELLEERAQKLEKELGITSSTPSKPVLSQEDAQEEIPPEQEAEQSVPTEQELLTKAKDHLAAGREVAAEAALRTHFAKYPKGSTHVEALYRYAEASFNQKKYQEAAGRFQEVLNTKSESSFASWALFRQGECFAALGDTDSARTFYEDVVNDYPKSKAAVEAKKKLSK